jgi:hypothetical protein
MHVLRFSRGENLSYLHQKVIAAGGVLTLLAHCAVSGGDDKIPSSSPIGELRLKWPGEPELHGFSGLSVATYTSAEKQDRVFRCVVKPLTGPKEDADTPQSLLEAYLGAGKKEEIERVAVEFGKNKFPALQVTSKITRKNKTLFRKQLVVVADMVLYDLSVSAFDNEFLSGKEAKSFFESLALPKEKRK